MGKKMLHLDLDEDVLKEKWYPCGDFWGKKKEKEEKNAKKTVGGGENERGEGENGQTAGRSEAKRDKRSDETENPSS